MKKTLCSIFLPLLLVGCSSVTHIEGSHYAATCHYLMSDESCAESVKNQCPNGYRIMKSDNSWSFFTGAQKKMFLECTRPKKRMEREIKCLSTTINLEDAYQKGFELVSIGDANYLVKGDKKILLSDDKKHLCKRVYR